MLRIDYGNSFVSADPILQLLRDRPDQVFSRPFIGYVILLFGSESSALARWLGDNIAPLSLISGDYLCISFFANHVPVRGKQVAGAGSNTEATLSSIRRVDADDENLLGSEQTLLATSRASYDIAHKLRIARSLPCLLLMDAFVAKEFFLVELGNIAPPEILSIVRGVVAELEAKEDFSMLAVHLNEIAQLDVETRQRLDTIKRIVAAREASADEIRAEALAEEAATVAAWKAVEDGSVRLLENACSRMKFISPGQRGETLALAAHYEQQLLTYGQTIHSLEYYACHAPWPLGPESTLRLERVLREHASPLLGRFATAASRDECVEVVEQLKGRRTKIINEVGQGLPRPSDVRQAGVSRVAQASKSYHDAESIVAAELGALRNAMEHKAGYFIASDAPRVADVFERVLAKHKIGALRHSAKELISANLPSLIDFFSKAAGVG